MAGRGDKEYLANNKSQNSIKRKSRITVQSHTGFLFCLLSRSYLTSSKINTVVYQIDMYSMVQIWPLKFKKSILDVISMLF